MKNPQSYWSRIAVGFVLFIPSMGPSAPPISVQVSAIVSSPPPPDPDIVDDFNDGNDLNYWDGIMGAMEEVSGDGSISRSFETAGAFAGRSLKLSYDFTRTSNWNGYFLNLNTDSLITKNISAYKHLSFWVKGSVGGVEHLKIGLENTSAESTNRSRVAVYVNDFLDGGITAQWQKVSIPLAAFSGLDSFATAKTVTFVFERSYVDPTLHPNLAQAGSVFIDDVRFSTVLLPELRIDPFGDRWGINALGGNWGDMNNVYRDIMPLAGEPFPYTMGSQYDSSESWQGHFCLFGGGNSGWTAYPINLSDYRYLKFRARARSATENPKTFKLEVQSTNSRSYLVPGLTTSDQTFTLDLNASGINKAAIKQINIIYERFRISSQGGNLVGYVYFDDFRFSVNP